MTHQDPSSGAGACRERILLAVRSFQAMPAFLSDVMAKLRDPDTDLTVLAERINFDPGTTANVLRLANSARFSGGKAIHSVREAIVRLGISQIWQMLVASHLSRPLMQTLSGYELKADELLEHSLWTALASEELCRTLHIHAPDMLFTAGLLHDTGKLVMDRFVAEHHAVLEAATSEGLSFDEAEFRALGITHCEAGASLLEHWKLPPGLVAAARWHHAPEKAGEYGSIVDMVHIAEFLAYSEGIGSGIDGLSYPLSDAAISRLKIKTTTLEYVASQTLQQVVNLRQALKA